MLTWSACTTLCIAIQLIIKVNSFPQCIKDQPKQPYLVFFSQVQILVNACK